MCCSSHLLIGKCIYSRRAGGTFLCALYSQLPVETVRAEGWGERVMYGLSSLSLIPFQSHFLCNGVTLWWIRTQRGGGRWKDTVYIQVPIFGHWISLTGTFLLNLFTRPPPPLVLLSRHVIFHSLIHACRFPGNRKERIRWISGASRGDCTF